jgi:ketosteroid isomerase-like protein
MASSHFRRAVLATERLNKLSLLISGSSTINHQPSTNGTFFWTTMKKISARILIVAIGVGSAALLGGLRAVAADPPAASPTATTAETSLGQQILSKEREELDAQKAGNFNAFGNLIADEAVVVDGDGPASKAEMIKRSEGIKLSEYSINDEKFLPISADTGLISYYITAKGTLSNGKLFTAAVYVSALWTKRGNDWVCLFHQETAGGSGPSQGARAIPGTR